jgi:hypothetical protein
VRCSRDRDAYIYVWQIAQHSCANGAGLQIAKPAGRENTASGFHANEVVLDLSFAGLRHRMRGRVSAVGESQIRSTRVMPPACHAAHERRHASILRSHAVFTELMLFTLEGRQAGRFAAEMCTRGLIRKAKPPCEV